MTIQKYKIKFSIWAFNESIPEPIQKIQKFIKMSAIPAAPAAWWISSVEGSFVITLLIGAIDFMFHFAYLEEIKNEEPTGK